MAPPHPFLCYNGCHLTTQLGDDDSRDVVRVHGAGGTWGAVATGLLATKAVNAVGADSLFSGHAVPLWHQVIGMLAAWVLGFVATCFILKRVDATMGLRVSEDEEVIDLDLAPQAETAYSLSRSTDRGR